jgi:hypothetical protein
MGTEQAVWECTFEVGVKLVHYAESNTWRVTVFDRAAAAGDPGVPVVSQQFQWYTQVAAQAAALTVVLEYLRERERARWCADAARKGV